MALNMALAAQYAAGVPVNERCQLVRNLVPKTPKATIVATASKNPNPAVKKEASLLATTPHLQSPPVHGKLVTKRGNRVMVSANPENTTTVGNNTSTNAAEPVQTTCKITNSTDLKLTLNSYKSWYGSGNPSKTIDPRKDETFVHYADDVGSFAGASYILGDTKIVEWVIVWSNKEGVKNKVYSEILDGAKVVDWAAILTKVETDPTVTNVSKVSAENFSSSLTIDPTNPAPEMTATLTTAT